MSKDGPLHEYAGSRMERGQYLAGAGRGKFSPGAGKIPKAANWLLFATAAFCFSLTGYCLWKYGLALRYGGLAALGILFLVLTQASESARVNSALVLLSFGMSLYAIELLLAVSPLARPSYQGPLWLHFASVFSPDDMHLKQERARGEGIRFDTRSRLEIIHEFEQRGIHAYPAMVPRIPLELQKDGTYRSSLSLEEQELLPLGGIANVTTVFCNENGEYTIYDSDEHGFHNPKGLWQQSAVDIVTLGDSFTHGACVSSEDSFVGRIRGRHPLTLNLGMDDNGPLMMLAALREYAAAYRPATVLWFYYEGNDLGDLATERNSPLLMSYLKPTYRQGLYDKQQQIDEVLADYFRELRDLHSPRPTIEQIVKIHHVVERAAGFFERRATTQPTEEEAYYERNARPVSPEDLDLFRTVLREAQQTIDEWGGRLVFVYLPQWDRYSNSRYVSQNREAVLRLVRTLAIPTIDLDVAFSAQKDPLALFPFRRSGHYTPEGHQLVADRILQYLSTQDEPLHRQANSRFEK
jgi:hypothetical protein